MTGWPGESCAFPGLKIQTWGTHHLAGVRVAGMGLCFPTLHKNVKDGAPLVVLEGEGGSSSSGWSESAGLLTR